MVFSCMIEEFLNVLEIKIASLTFFSSDCRHDFCNGGRRSIKTIVIDVPHQVRCEGKIGDIEMVGYVRHQECVLLF